MSAEWTRAPFKPDTWPFDADGHAPDLCTACGTPVRYGERHNRCGGAANRITVRPNLQSGQQEYLVPIPREQAAPARLEDMMEFAAEMKADPAKAHAFFRSSGIIDEHGGLTPEYGGQSMTDAQMEAATLSDEASQERAAIAYKRGYEEGLNDCLRNGLEWARSLFTDQGEHIKPQEQAEPVAWRHDHGAENGGFEYYEDASCPQCQALYLHPPAAEVQRLREALKPFAAIDLTTKQAVDPMDVLRARGALKGGE